MPLVNGTWVKAKPETLDIGDGVSVKLLPARAEARIRTLAVEGQARAVAAGGAEVDPQVIMGITMSLCIERLPAIARETGCVAGWEGVRDEAGEVMRFDPELLAELEYDQRRAIIGALFASLAEPEVKAATERGHEDPTPPPPDAT